MTGDTAADTGPELRAFRPIFEIALMERGGVRG